MERLRFRIGHLLTGIACLSVAVALIIGSVLLNWYDGIHSQRVSPEPFDAFRESRDCSVQIQLLAGPFASSHDDKQNFYWGYGMMMEPVIICFTGELPGPCAALLEYTGGLEVTEAPDPVLLRGRSAVIENTDLYDYAMEFYQTMWGLAPMDRNEFKETVAVCYLDTQERSWIQKLPGPGAVLVFLLPAVFFVLGIWQCKSFQLEKKRERQRIACLRDGEMAAAVRQLETATEFEPRSRVYLTTDFVITGNCQFDIIPYDQIVSLEETGGFLIAVTKDGMAHFILSAGHKRLSQLSWLTHFKRALEDKIRYAQTETEGDDYAVISGY